MDSSIMIHCAVAASVLYVIFDKNYSVFNAVTLSCKLYTSILNILFYTGLAQHKVLFKYVFWIGNQLGSSLKRFWFQLNRALPRQNSYKIFLNKTLFESKVNFPES